MTPRIQILWVYIGVYVTNGPTKAILTVQTCQKHVSSGPGTALRRPDTTRVVINGDHCMIIARPIESLWAEIQSFAFGSHRVPLLKTTILNNILILLLILLIGRA